MNLSAKMKMTLLGAIIGLSAGIAGASMEMSPTTNEFRFDVFLDDRRIGYHNFLLTENAGAQELQSEARFDVKVLFITAFRYRHQNRERWEAGCLSEISSTTKSNGREFVVDGVRSGEELVLETVDAETKIDDCVMTFAYWDKAFLSQDRLLNSQTGEYLDVKVSPPSAEVMDTAVGSVAVDCHGLTAREIDIKVCYRDVDGEWVGLDSNLKGGRQLRYRRAGL